MDRSLPVKTASIAAKLTPFALLFLFGLTGCGSADSDVEILNVSYDPTRELYRKLNRDFIEEQKNKGVAVRVRQSHGGSGSQARAVMDGIPADVVTLALWSDTNAIAKKGLLAKDWDARSGNEALPYYSTVVFVVRKGNPKGIHDWPDLIHPDVKIITPNPKTSGGAKLNLLAAWGSVLRRHGIDDNSTAEQRAIAEQAAEEFVTQLYRQCPVLDSGARGSTITFARRMIGDVHVTWENEAWLEVNELGDELEIIYPSCSIKAEPYVAIVDENVDRKGTREVAEAYLKFLHSEKAQKTIVENGYRPADENVEKEYRARFPDRLPKMDLFRIDYIDRGGWDAAQKRFFADGGVFDRIYQPTGD